MADADEAFNFEGATAKLRAVIPPSLRAFEIARGALDDATVRTRLLDSVNQGQKVVNYFGHGSVDLLRGNILVADDAGGLTNGNHLSLFVMMTCLNGYFQDAASDSLAEAMLKARRGGAVAAWASTGMSDPGEQATLNQEFYRLLFGNESLTIGQAAMKAKASVTDRDIRRTWVLLGDPTTRLR